MFLAVQKITSIQSINDSILAKINKLKFDKLSSIEKILTLVCTIKLLLSKANYCNVSRKIKAIDS